MHFLRNSLSIALFSFVSANAFGQQTNTNKALANACPVPDYTRIQPSQGLTAEQTINIISGTTDIRQDKFAKFTGGVTFFSEDQAIIADALEVNQETETFSATGNIHFQNNSIDVFASQLFASKSSKTTEMLDSAYQLNGNPGHGSAAKINISADGNLILTDASYSSCYGDKPDWQLKAGEINISKEENIGEAYNARIMFFDVPVLYIPYFSFPVSEERKSGFLYPQISSSGNSGFQIETPYYWNIAPNMDATITPKYMSKRGLQLLTEFRYLQDLQSGEINLEYLHKDDELVNNNDARYLARWQHIGTFSENFRANIDYTTISDDNYLVDIKSDQYNSNDAYLYQTGELAYFQENWHAKVKLQDFEVLGEEASGYRTLPHIEFSSFYPMSFLNGEFDIYSEITRFDTDDLSKPEADRYHFEAGVTIPVATPAWFVNSELRLLQTNYHQSRIEDNENLEENVSRTLPKARIHGGINFDRKANYFGQSFTQTLEPQLQYLYVPDEDQSNIGIYDTTKLQDDYNGLFRDQRFSGLDRIAQANQYSWGITSRLLDASNKETLRVSLGRIVYLNDSNVDEQNNVISSDESALAAEVFTRISERWQFSSDIQYSTDNNVTNKSQSTLDYRFDDKHLVQLNHRYSRNVSDNKLEQVSLLSAVTLNKDWQFVGRFTQDLQDRRSLETYAGFQYESCCWAVRFSYYRHINSNIDEQTGIIENRDEFDSGFMVKFIIKGLGGKKTRIDTSDMFDDSIFGYKRPYFLNN